MYQVEKSRELITGLETKIETQRAQLRDLAMMGTVITSIHEIDAVLSVVMDMAIRLVDGEVGMIMIDEVDGLTSKVSWGVDEKFLKNLMYKDGIDLPTYCYKNREAVILADLGMESSEGMILQSLLALPIKTSDKCLGVISILNKAGGGNFSDEDRETLEMLLNFVAVAVDNSILMKKQLKQQKIQQEMAIARQVQETILPPDVNNFDGVEIGAIYFPARDVGGDFYNVIPLSDKKLIIVIGDVSNKGVPAALVMSSASGIISTIVESRPDISVSALASRVNDTLSNHIIRDREMFVTMFFCILDLEQGEITYCNGGHLPGLFWDESAQKIHELSEGGPIVGQFPGIEFKQGSRDLSSGDRLFLFTDGLTEAADSEDNLFGRERVEQVFSVERGVPPHEFCLKVKQWVDRFTEGGSDDMIDDFTLMQVKVD